MNETLDVKSSIVRTVTAKDDICPDKNSPKYRKMSELDNKVDQVFPWLKSGLDKLH